MKTFVLLVWLITGNGKEQFLSTQHVDDEAKCLAMAQRVSDQHAMRGERVRTLCHYVVPEISGDDLDANGSPIKR